MSAATAVFDPATIDLDDPELPDDRLYDAVDRIEAALERVPGTGLTPSAAARHAGVSTSTADALLRWMVTHQYAHDDARGAWTRYYAGRPR